MSSIPATTPQPRLRRGYLYVLIGMHLAALLAVIPYFWTWWAIPILLVGNFIFGSIGINLGYHRLLTHKSVEMPKWLEKTCIWLGICSLEGLPIPWVTTHRIHHQHSDIEGDPHSPVDHFYWGHMGWIVYEDCRMKQAATYEKYVPDLVTDRYLKYIHKKNRWFKGYAYHVLAIVIGSFLLGAAVTQDWLGAVRFMAIGLVWGVFVRTVYVWHITWFVNSASHRFGYRNYETKDSSTNCWWVALLTNGEGWHNNHHAAPRAMAHGHRWWEIDLTYTFVKLLALVGLAKNIVPVKVASYKSLDKVSEPTSAAA
jgi:fatty-acid desaturase